MNLTLSVDGQIVSRARKRAMALGKSWLFRHFSGLRSQVQTATVEQDGGSKVLLVAETMRRVLDPLDLGIDGFAGSVGDAVAEVGNYVLKAPLQGSSHFEHGAQPTAYGPALPPTKMFSRGPLILVVEECHGGLFQSPGPCRLQPALT
jgi:hypothetical protein